MSLSGFCPRHGKNEWVGEGCETTPSPIPTPKPSVPGLPCPNSLEIWDFSRVPVPSCFTSAPLATFLPQDLCICSSACQVLGETSSAVQKSLPQRGIPHQCFPPQYSCLENPMGRGIWRATAHRVAKVWYDWNDLAHTHAQVGDNLDLELAIDKWGGGQSCRTEPLICGVWCFLQIDNNWIEFTCTTPSWYQGIARWCGENNHLL